MHATSRSGNDIDLKPINNNQKIIPHKLDISNPENISSFHKSIIDQNGSIDVLINNAGVNLDDNFNLSNAQKTIQTNYKGTLKLCSLFLPNIRENGRIVNLSSTASSLKLYSKEIQNRFRSVSSISQVDNLVDEYIMSVKNKNQKENGWPNGSLSYSISKACINSMTRILAKENQDKGILINCCCPGWVSSDMGKQTGNAPKSLEEGSRIPIHLAFDDLNNVSGKYWGNDSVHETGIGKVQDW